MFTDEKKAGIKEFFLILLVVLVLSTLGSFVSYILPSYKIFGHIAGIILIGIYGISVVKSYCSVFCYLERENYFLIRRELGAMSKEVKVRYADIYLLTNEKPNLKIQTYCARILPRKTDLYIVLKSNREEAVRISDDDGEIYKLLKEKSKG